MADRLNDVTGSSSLCFFFAFRQLGISDGDEAALELGDGFHLIQLVFQTLLFRFQLPDSPRLVGEFRATGIAGCQGLGRGFHKRIHILVVSKKAGYPTVE